MIVQNIFIIPSFPSLMNKDWSWTFLLILVMVWGVLSRLNLYSIRCQMDPVFICLQLYQILIYYSLLLLCIVVPSLNSTPTTPPPCYICDLLVPSNENPPRDLLSGFARLPRLELLLGPFCDGRFDVVYCSGFHLV